MINEMEHYFEQEFPEDEMDQPEDFDPSFFDLSVPVEDDEAFDWEEWEEATRMESELELEADLEVTLEHDSYENRTHS